MEEQGWETNTNFSGCLITLLLLPSCCSSIFIFPLLVEKNTEIGKCESKGKSLISNFFPGMGSFLLQNNKSVFPYVLNREGMHAERVEANLLIQDSIFFSSFLLSHREISVHNKRRNRGESFILLSWKCDVLE